MRVSSRPSGVWPLQSAISYSNPRITSIPLEFFYENAQLYTIVIVCLLLAIHGTMGAVSGICRNAPKIGTQNPRERLLLPVGRPRNRDQIYYDISSPALRHTLRVIFPLGAPGNLARAILEFGMILLGRCSFFSTFQGHQFLPPSLDDASGVLDKRCPRIDHYSQLTGEHCVPGLRRAPSPGRV